MCMEPGQVQNSKSDPGQQEKNRKHYISEFQVTLQAAVIKTAYQWQKTYLWINGIELRIQKKPQGPLAI